MKMMQKITLMALVASLYNQPIFAMSEEALEEWKKAAGEAKAAAAQQFPIASASSSSSSTKENIQLLSKLGIRRLIIIFDPENNEWSIQCSNPRALQGTLKQALVECSAPIITTPFLYEYAKKCVFTDSTINQQWKKYRTRGDDKYLVVLIPNREPYNVWLSNIDSSPRPLTESELMLGIKIRQLQEMPNNFNTSAVKMNLKEELQKILITYNDLKKAGLPDDHSNMWDIYLTGHGNLESKNKRAPQEATIASIPIPSFKQFLNFLNYGISTRSFYYDTCFGGGTHLKEPYQYEIEKDAKHANAQVEKEARDQNLKFLIISATTYAKTTQADIQTAPSGQTIVATINFNAYFTTLNNYFQDSKEHTKEELSKAINYLSTWEKSFDPARPEWLQLPAVRFPNTEKFVNPDMDKIFQLTDRAIEHAIQHGKKELKIPKETKIILLQSHYVPIKITIEGDSMPLLLPSTNTVNSSYFFKEIEAPNVYLFSENKGLVTFSKMIENIKERFYETGRVKRALNIPDAKVVFLVATLILKRNDQSKSTLKDSLVNLSGWGLPTIKITTDKAENFDFRTLPQPPGEYDPKFFLEEKSSDASFINLINRAKKRALMEQYLTFKDKPALLDTWKKIIPQADLQTFNDYQKLVDKAFSFKGNQGAFDEWLNAMPRPSGGYTYSDEYHFIRDFFKDDHPELQIP